MAQAYDLTCLCFCGCRMGDEDGSLFQCCGTWFCPTCFSDHVEDSEDHDN